MINIGKISEVIKDGTRKIITEYFGGYTKTANQITTSGIDSSPLSGDQGCVIEVTDSNGKALFIGTYNDSSVEPGEIKIYSRDASGTLQASIYCDSTGLIEVKNQLTSQKEILIDFIESFENSFDSTGAPTLHNAIGPNLTLALASVKNKVNQLYK